MIFNPVFYYVLIVLISAVTSFVLGKACKKLFLNKEVLNFIVHFLVFVSMWSILYRISCDVLILKSNEKYKKLVFIGNTEIELDGINYKLQEIDYDDSFIINKTNKPLVFETIDYGKPAVPRLRFDFVHILEPDSMWTRKNTPDYYPWDIPPEKVSTFTGNEWELKTWIRYANEEEISEYQKFHNMR